MANEPKPPSGLQATIGLAYIFAIFAVLAVFLSLGSAVARLSSDDCVEITVTETDGTQEIRPTCT
jgi:hypothetical protein